MKRPTTLCALTLFGIAASAWFTPRAAATDGVIEINQARALAGNVTPGDGAGFPVTLSRSGSYRLTSNLDIRGLMNPELVDVIQVTADYVTIDLNGFSIIGATTCSGGPPVTACNPATGTGSGVNANGYVGLVVRNGSIRGMGYCGIYAGPLARLENLSFEMHRVSGALTVNNSTIVNCQSRLNGSSGFSVTGVGGLVSGNVCTGNNSSGIYVNGANLVVNNTLHQNTQGIQSSGGATIIANTVSANTSWGLALSPTASTKDGYGQNVLTGNGGTVTGGIQMGPNICNGTTVCP